MVLLKCPLNFENGIRSTGFTLHWTDRSFDCLVREGRRKPEHKGSRVVTRQGYQLECLVLFRKNGLLRSFFFFREGLLRGGRVCKKGLYL